MQPDQLENRRRLLRLVEFVDAETPCQAIGDNTAADLYNCGDALREALAETASDPERASDEEVCRVVLDRADLPCPSYLASLSEGSGESTYRDNPTYLAGNAGELGESLGASYEEGWACNWIVSLDSGQHILWETRCRLLGEQYICVSADTVAEADWIVLDCDGKPGDEPRRVTAIGDMGDHVHFTFTDADPGATFRKDERVWRRRRDGDAAIPDDSVTP